MTQVELQEAEQRVKQILGDSAVNRVIRPAEENEVIELPPITGPKKPRHVSVAINHLLAQRTKAIKVRDKAAEEVESLDAALLALGWGE